MARPAVDGGDTSRIESHMARHEERPRHVESRCHDRDGDAAAAGGMSKPAGIGSIISGPADPVFRESRRGQDRAQVEEVLLRCSRMRLFDDDGPRHAEGDKKRGHDRRFGGLAVDADPAQTEDIGPQTETRGDAPLTGGRLHSGAQRRRGLTVLHRASEDRDDRSTAAGHPATRCRTASGR